MLYNELMNNHNMKTFDIIYMYLYLMLVPLARICNACYDIKAWTAINHQRTKGVK